MKSFKGTSVLITGATGFIGRHLVNELLKVGFDVYVLIRRPDEQFSKLLGKDRIIITDFEELAIDTHILSHIHTVIHLAAHVHNFQKKSQLQYDEYIRINRKYTVKLAKTCIENNVGNFIFFSTVKVIDDNKKYDFIIDETMQKSPNDEYSISKSVAEDDLESLYEKEKNKKCIIIRIPLVYGPDNKGNMLTLLKAALRKIYLPLDNRRSGKRSLVYVGNICSAIATLLDNIGTCNVFEVFNLTDGIDYTSNTLYSAIFSSMHNKKGTFYFPLFLFRILGLFHSRIRAINTRLFNEYRFSSRKFQEKMGWTPPYSLEFGMKETVAWYKENNT